MRNDRDPRALARELGADAVTPKWPDRVWVALYRSNGYVSDITAIPQDGSDTYRIRVPARLVPLDGSAVVLNREDADSVARTLYDALMLAQSRSAHEKAVFRACGLIARAIEAAKAEGNDVR